MTALNERLGASLRRSPYVWTVATILFFFVMMDALNEIEKDYTSTSAPLAFLGLGIIVADLFFALVVLPHQTARGAPSTRSTNTVALMNWTFAVSAFWAGYAAVAAGGQQWVLAIGWITSVALLVRTARQLRRSGSLEPSA